MINYYIYIYIYIYIYKRCPVVQWDFSYIQHHNTYQMHRREQVQSVLGIKYTSCGIGAPSLSAYTTWM